MANYLNIDGIAGKSLSIGLGKNPPKLIAYENGSVGFNCAFDNGTQIVRSKHSPANDADMINLAYLKFSNNSLYSQIISYVEFRIKESLGGDEDDPMTDGNLMLKPVMIENLVDPITYEVGLIFPQKFIYSVVFEVRKMFTDWHNFMFQMAVGDDKDQQRFVPWSRISGIENTMEFKVCETLGDFTQVNLYFRMREAPPIGPVIPDRPPFEQTFTNKHDHNKIRTRIKADADWQVVTFYVDADDVSGQHIIDYAQWYYDYYNKFDLLDFEFNMPITLDHVGHEYAVLEINPALEYVKGFGGLEATEVTYDDGLWKRYYKFRATDSWEWIHKILLKHAESEEDYCHVWLYDLEAEDPEMPIMAYHIWNGIMVPEPEPQDPNTQFIRTSDETPMRLIAITKNPKATFDRLTVDKPPIFDSINLYSDVNAKIDAVYDNVPIQQGQQLGNVLEDVTIQFASEDEAMVTELLEPDMTKFIHLEGGIKSKARELQKFYPGIEGNYTLLTMQFNNVKKGSAKLIIFNPAYEWFYNNTNHNGLIERLILRNPDTGEDYSVYYMNLEGYLDGTDDIIIDIPIGEKDPNYDIQVVFFRGEDVTDTDFITIINDLKFMKDHSEAFNVVGSGVDAPVTPINYVKAPTVAYEGLAVPIPVPTAGDVPVAIDDSGTIDDDDIPHSNGQAIVRVISF